MGGQQALEQLALMDHHIVKLEKGSLLDRLRGAGGPGGGLKSRRTGPETNGSTTSAKNSSIALPGPMKSFEDCAVRFEGIESQLAAVLGMQKEVLQAVSALQKR